MRCQNGAIHPGTLMIDLATSLRIAEAALLTLLAAAAVAWRRPLVRPVPEPSQRYGYPNVLRWVWFVFAAGFTTMLLVAGTRAPPGDALAGLALAVASGAAFAFCSRRVVEIRSDAVVFNGVFERREIALARVRALTEFHAPRGGHAMVAFDEWGRRLFSLSDNLQGFAEAVGRVKQGVVDGTVVRQRGMSSGERIVRRGHGSDHPEA
jgi:hypothetical protein